MPFRLFSQFWAQYLSDFLQDLMRPDITFHAVLEGYELRAEVVGPVSPVD